MRVVGFLIFLFSVLAGNVWGMFAGLVIYELTGVTWMAAISSGTSGSRDDHRPMNLDVYK